jgi:two-component system chemotaxis sensor kinase CheA
MDPILRKFRDKFYEEANGLLDRLEKDMLELEKTSDNKELIESAFRVMHTIKGVSGMYGFDFISEFTHNMENVYSAIRDNKLKFSKEIFNLTFLSIDHIRKLLSDEKMAEVDNQSTHNMLLADIKRIINVNDEKGNSKPQLPEIKEEKADKVKKTWHILVNTNESMYFRGINIVNIMADLSQLGEFQITRLEYLNQKEVDTWSIILTSDCKESDIQEVFLFIEDDCVITCIASDDILDNPDYFQQYLEQEPDIAEQTIIDFIESSGKPTSNEESANGNKIQGPLHKKVQALKAERNQSLKRISVDAAKLDHLMYLVSELITVNSQLLLATHDNKFDSIRPFTEKVDSLSKQFRNNALEIRLVPLSDTVLRFQRLIRDLSQQLNKKIELVTHGIDTELDKNTIDQLNEPLMHIIRNCIDHGIEFPDVRLKKGKSETGVLKISAYNSGNYVVIKVEDDGTGINLEKVKQKAIDRGHIKSGDKPTKKELFDFIFMPGFSTAQSLTEVSGRGVGLDVVRRKIIDLRGDIIIESEEGKGTSFTLKLQQSLAITDALLFKVEDSFFIIPISDIKICNQYSDIEISQRKYTATIPFENSLIPFIDLRETLDLGGKYGKKIKAIIIRSGDQLIALLADSIVGEHQAVLKPLGKSFRQQEYISAASQLGDGNLAFMIDTIEILKLTGTEKYVETA